MIQEYEEKYKLAVESLGRVFKSPYQVDLTGEYTHILLYLKEDEVIGFIQYQKLYENVEIEYLAVDEKYRKLGVGSEFIDYLARDLEVSSIVLEVRTTNEVAISFYEKNGFKRVRPIKGYYRDGEDALFMEKVIR